MKKKRRLSPEGRAKIAAAVRARWARQKKEGKSSPAKKKPNGQKGYWAAMTPAQRQAEMARRVAARSAKKAA